MANVAFQEQERKCETQGWLTEHYHRHQSDRWAALHACAAMPAQPQRKSLSRSLLTSQQQSDCPMSIWMAPSVRTFEAIKSGSGRPQAARAPGAVWVWQFDTCLTAPDTTGWPQMTPAGDSATGGWQPRQNKASQHSTQQHRGSSRREDWLARCVAGSLGRPCWACLEYRDTVRGGHSARVCQSAHLIIPFFRSLVPSTWPLRQRQQPAAPTQAPFRFPRDVWENWWIRQGAPRRAEIHRGHPLGREMGLKMEISRQKEMGPSELSFHQTKEKGTWVPLELRYCTLGVVQLVSCKTELARKDRPDTHQTRYLVALAGSPGCPVVSLGVVFGIGTDWVPRCVAQETIDGCANDKVGKIRSPLDFHFDIASFQFQ